MSGRRALVTGASKGIGRAIAERLARDGHAVAVHYGADRPGAEATLRTITEAGGNARRVIALGGDQGLDLLGRGLDQALQLVAVQARVAAPAEQVEIIF